MINNTLRIFIQSIYLKERKKTSPNLIVHHNFKNVRMNDSIPVKTDNSEIFTDLYTHEYNY